MRTYEAFDLTVKHFNIRAKDLAAQSGVNESSISRYRKGEQSLSTDALDNLLAALPEQARQYMVFNHLLSDLDEQAIGTLLYAISLKLRGVVNPPEMERLTA
ncbi:MAG: helix-turn-helix transcriptional regulator [Leptolyngbyaceae cyanobacterium bins.302]|nr:helix-turn-helix transcriptional regulator [Leptolyngbyaceae cyanobacterium bins.302]